MFVKKIFVHENSSIFINEAYIYQYLYMYEIENDI